MSIASVTYRHAFGFKTPSNCPLIPLDEDTVAWIAGRHVVIYNCTTKTQRFLPTSEHSASISALAISPNRRFLAVAEVPASGSFKNHSSSNNLSSTDANGKSSSSNNTAEEGSGPKTGFASPSISIFDVHTLRKRRVLNAVPEVSSARFVAIDFSADSKFLITQSGAPDWTLTYWSWDKGKALASTKSTNPLNAAVNSVSICPLDSTMVAVAGKGFCKTYRYADGVMRIAAGSMTQRRDGESEYTCLAWASVLDDRMVAGTTSGEVHMFEGGEYKGVVAKTDKGTAIHSIAVYSRGMAVSGMGDTLYFFDRPDSGGPHALYKAPKRSRLDVHAGAVTHLSFAPSEEILYLSTARNQAYSLRLSRMEVSKPEDVLVEPVMGGRTHWGKIVSADVATRKPLVATIGAHDNAVHLWNFVKRSVETVKVFAAEPTCVAMHPSGFHVLVGFADKLRLMNVMIDNDIRAYREFSIRSCPEARFSNSGGLFAAVNGSQISVYNTYTFELMATLRGHSARVNYLYWSPDDTRIVSAGVDGALYEWDWKMARRSSEVVVKGVSYTGIWRSQDSGAIYATGSDNKLREIVDSTVAREWTADRGMTALTMTSKGRSLIIGTDAGTIRVYQWPVKSGEFVEHIAHEGPVAKLVVSPDDNTLISVGEDGAVFVYDLRERDGGNNASNVGSSSGAIGSEGFWSEETLIMHSDVEDKNMQMSELKSKVEELIMQNEYQLRLKDLNYSEKIKELSGQFEAELDSEKTRYELLLQEKNDMEMAHDEAMKRIQEKHAEEQAAADAEFQTKFVSEVARYQELAEEKNQLSRRWEEQMQLVQGNHEAVVRELGEDYEGRLEEAGRALDALRREANEAANESAEERRQMDLEADAEIESVRERYERILTVERDNGFHLKGENGIMRKKFATLQKEIGEQKVEIEKQFREKAELYKVIDGLEKDIGGLKMEIKERDETIGDKEKRIYDLKKKNQELEKFKFVLDYKIRELKDAIEPKDSEIISLRQQIKEMDEELERTHRNLDGSELTLKDLQSRATSVGMEVRACRKRIADREAALRRIRKDIAETVDVVLDPKALKAAVISLNERHVKQETSYNGLAQDVAKEFARQRDALEKKVTTLQHKLNKDSQAYRADNARIMAENMALIAELNQLRREVKSRRVSGAATPRGGMRRGKSELASSSLAAAIATPRRLHAVSRTNLMSGGRVLRGDLPPDVLAQSRGGKPRPSSVEKLPMM